MEEPILHNFQLIGRKEERSAFQDLLSRMVKGEGSTLLVSGEAGIGKSRLIEEYRRCANEHARILHGSTDSSSLIPFEIFARALEGISNQPIFRKQEHTSFSHVFAVDGAGLLLAQASSEDYELDADIFAGMLSAVQGFVRDSFDLSDGKKSGLGRLEYGDKKIIMEHGQHIFLTAVFDGAEHKDMKQLVKETVKAIESDHGDILESWSGNMEKIRPIEVMVNYLANIKFLVKQKLEGATLETERLRIAGQILEIVTELSKEQPVLILLEDLHWAEESSLFVLNFLARNIRNERVMILGTLRPNESQILDTRLEKMIEDDLIIEQKLNALSSEEVVSLVSELFAENDLTEDFIKMLAGKCKGNPFFIIELLGQMVDEGSIGEKNGKYTLLSKEYSIPSSIEDVVHRKLERLEPNEIALVEYASCIGLQFDRGIMNSIQIIPDISSTLDKLASTRIFITYDDHIEFSHALFQDVIYQSMGSRWRYAYHKNLGDHYEKNHNQNLDNVIYELARHYSNSKEHSKAFDYCIMAGEKAESEFAPEQALELYRSALSAHRNLRQNTREETTVDLLETIGDLLDLVSEWDNALHMYDEAFGISNDKIIKARMLRKMGDVYENKGDFDKTLKVLDEAKTLLDDKASDEYARICHLEGGIYGKKGEREKGLAILQEGLAIFEEKGDSPRDIAIILRAIGLFHLRLGQFDPALDNYNKSLAIMRDIGDEYGMAAALNNIGVLYNEIGDSINSLEYHQRSMKIKEKIGDKAGISASLNNIGNVFYIKGELDKALESHHKGLIIKEKIGDQWGFAASLLNMGVIYVKKGDLDSAHDNYEKSLIIWERIGDKMGLTAALNNIAEVNLLKGDLDTALDFYTRNLEIREKAGNRKGCALTLCGLALTNIGLGNNEIALSQAKEALEISIDINAIPEEGKSLRVLGQVYRKMEEIAMAEDMFQKSLQRLEKIDSKNELIFTYYEHALLQIEQGQLDKARENLEKVLPMFQDMGMKLWEDKCQTALDGL